MYTLKDNGIVEEIACGNNFGYLLSDSKYFANTDYKVLQSQTSGIFVPCSQNIDISWDKIFVDPATLKVRLVYLPVNVRVFESFSEFQSELRSSLIKLIDKILPESSERMDKFVPDLANGSMSLEEIFNKYKGAGGGGEYQSPRPNT